MKRSIIWWIGEVYLLNGCLSMKIILCVALPSWDGDGGNLVVSSNLGFAAWRRYGIGWAGVVCVQVC